MNDTAPTPVARVYRGENLEAIHYASIAVVDSTGRLTHYLGDPDLTVAMRSSIKPFQLIPTLTTGAADHFGFTPRQLAIMCGSHSGSDEHREVVLSNLNTAGNEPSDLLCGSGWPIGMQEAREWPLHGEDKDPLRADCSGKHSGFLALARFLGDPRGKYLDPDSATQQLVKQAVAEYCEYPVEKMTACIDGCSAPNYPLPVRNLALGYMKLASAVADDDRVRHAVRRIREAMRQHAEMVSGEGRFDLALSRASSYNVLCKVGAEAVEGVGFADPPLGIAVKMHDGHTRALWAVCIEVLKQLGLLGELPADSPLRPFERPEVRNARGLVTGSIRVGFELRRA